MHMGCIMFLQIGNNKKKKVLFIYFLNISHTFSDSITKCILYVDTVKAVVGR